MAEAAEERLLNAGALLKEFIADCQPGIAFDKDGTLVNSEEWLQQAIQLALTELGAAADKPYKVSTIRLICCTQLFLPIIRC